MKVSDCMTQNFILLQPQSTIQAVLEKFLNHRLDIGCILHPDGKLDGIITKYTIYRMLLNRCPLDTPIAPNIIRDVITVDINTPLTEARDMLITANVAHAVVLGENKKVLGVMATGDLFAGFLLETRRLANQLTSLIENMEDGVIAIDNNHKIHTFNSAAERLLQLPRHAVLGGHAATTLPQFGVDMINALENCPRHDSKKIRLPSAVVLATYAPIVFRHQITGSIAVLKDLTTFEKVAHELETTKKLERILQSALEMAYDGIAIIDEQGRISMVNDALLELYNLSRGELFGAKASEKIPELNLEETLLTGSESIGDIQKINGKKCVITRMPIIRKEKQVGAIAKVMFRHLDHLKDLFNRLEHLENELTYYRGEYLRATIQGTVLDHIITRNPEMERLKNQAYLAAQSFSTVLITGESGTGKELFAQAIHEISGRPGKFVKVNCAAIPGELLESEFFGYAEGAFTGARKGGKPGKFEIADGGTLFLDEIGDMPLSLQAKLLRVLQERSFERVGDTQTTHVNVRILAATNKRLEELILEGKFREDLYYRINVIHLAIPSLRERREDLPLLCEHLIQKLNRILNKHVHGATPPALEILSKYHWPGNVRELENILERAMNLESSDWIEPHHLPASLPAHGPVNRLHAKTSDSSTDSSGTVSLNKRDVLAAAEKDLILKALDECGGNRSRAAAKLGMSRSTLYQKMRTYQIAEKSYFESPSK